MRRLQNTGQSQWEARCRSFGHRFVAPRRRVLVFFVATRLVSLDVTGNANLEMNANLESFFTQNVSNQSARIIVVFGENRQVTTCDRGTMSGWRRDVHSCRGEPNCRLGSLAGTASSGRRRLTGWASLAFPGRNIAARFGRCRETGKRYGDDLLSCPVLARFLGSGWPMLGERS